jgi:hypothetical protein
MSETVTVTEVGPTNQWGYAEVKFAERGPAKTKSTEIIARADRLRLLSSTRCRRASSRTCTSTSSLA